MTKKNQAAVRLGKRTSAKKKAASAANGKLGGRPARPALERLFTDREITPAGCWIYRGRRSGTYGQVFYDGELMRAHRAAWTLLRGPLAAGDRLRRTCTTPECFNPEHWTDQSVARPRGKKAAE